MPIYAPARRINPSIRRRGTGRKGVYASLFLTSMVDMFAILVIFLLQSFSSEGELIVLPQGLELPKVKNTGSLEEAPSLVIGLEEVIFQGEVVAQTSDVIQMQEWNIPKLQEVLTNFKAQREAETIALRELDEKTKIDLQKINISADRRLSFSTVKKVIYTAGFAGFPYYQLAVFQAAKAPEGPVAHTE